MDNSGRTLRHHKRHELLPSCSKDTFLTLDTFIDYLNTKIWTLLNISGMHWNVLFRRGIQPLAVLWISGLSCRIHGDNCIQVPSDISRVNATSRCSNSMCSWELCTILCTYTLLSGTSVYLLCWLMKIITNAMLQHSEITETIQLLRNSVSIQSHAILAEVCASTSFVISALVFMWLTDCKSLNSENCFSLFIQIITIDAHAAFRQRNYSEKWTSDTAVEGSGEFMQISLLGLLFILTS